jgi:hydroxyisourate hydrolase
VGRLTTHVLDTSAGMPAGGVRIEVHEAHQSGSRLLLANVTTGDDGRVKAPLLAGETLRAGRLTLTFHIGDYFRRRGLVLPEPPFFERAIIDIGVAHPDQHYHVPLLVTPWSYSVYRGG